MIHKLNEHYSMTNPASIYDEESLTALELAGRTTAVVNECVEHVNAQDKDIAHQKEVVIPATIKNEVQNQIDNGTFDQAIDVYAGRLENRVDNLLGSMTTGSTTMDAEIIDARLGVDGVADASLGNAIRRQHSIAMNHTDSIVGFERKNLITGLVEGKFLNGSANTTTVITELNGTAYTTPIYLLKGDVVYTTWYATYGNNNRFCDQCNENDVPVKRIANERETTDYNQYTIPESGFYCFNTKADGVVTLNLDYLTYAGINSVYLPTNIVNTEVITKNVETFHRINLIKTLNSGYVANGGVYNSTHLMYSNPIHLVAGDIVYTSYSSAFGTNQSLYAWDIENNKPNGAFVSKFNTDSTEYNEYHITADGYYTVNTNGSYGYCVKDLNNINEPIGCYMPDDVLNHGAVSVLTGKTISFNGDSICAGDGYNGGYGKFIADKYHMVYENIAVGGGTITAEQYRADNGSARHWISRTVASMNPNADYIILEGGVNDASLGVELGTITTGYADTLDDTTFYGAFESMCKQLVTTFAGKKVGYIFVHKMTSGFNSLYQNNYYTAAKECCEKWGVPYLDLNVQCPPFNYIDSLKATYTANGDGWHPNEEGYKKYYVPKITSWLESL